MPRPEPCAPWVRPLLRWYRRVRRPLPWRAQGVTPYAVWVSEIMLQQTRVETVAPYYRRFLERFPDVRSLAAAAPQRVLKAWEGLGYYGRARRLHAAAALLLREAGGELPRTAAELRRLPGVGDYTAAAVASICFGAREAVVDGNVERVAARFFGVETDPGTAAARTDMARRLRDAMGGVRPGDFNQALMELGALVCLPAAPRCRACPLRSGCVALRRGLQSALPARSASKPVPLRVLAAAVCRRGDRWLLVRRPPQGLLGGLWEFPCVRMPAGVPGRREVLAALRRALLPAAGVGRRHEPVRHAYSHFRVVVHPFEVSLQGGAAPAGRWVTLRGARRLPLTRVALILLQTSISSALPSIAGVVL
jgi:A/G-specific adenine glycosylase